MSKIRRITVKHVEDIAFRLAEKTMGLYEPIPPFSSRLPQILESCVVLKHHFRAIWERKYMKAWRQKHQPYFI